MAGTHAHDRTSLQRYIYVLITGNGERSGNLIA
jgi:hypothetical protein